jgi:hypothetical protein
MAAPVNGATLDDVYEKLEGVITALGGITVDPPVGGALETTQILTKNAVVAILAGRPYETVAASATDQVLGATGAIGDVLDGVLIQPGTTSPGTVVVKDGATTVYTFPGGASSASNLWPVYVPLNLTALGAGFKITTGADVTALATGSFT